MRISYRLDLRHKSEISSRDIINRGAKIAKAGYPLEEFAISADAIERPGYPSRLTYMHEDSIHQFQISKDVNYGSPALDLAKEFAEYIGDKSLLKFLEKFEKYNEELYKRSYRLSALELAAYKSNNYYEGEKEKVEQDINEINSDYNMSRTEKKKKLVIKRKELEQIKERAKQREKDYLKKYIKLHKKMHAKQMRANKGPFRHSKMEKYSGIISEIKRASMHGRMFVELPKEQRNQPSRLKQYYIISSKQNNERNAIPLVIDKERKKELFERLAKKYYGQTNSNDLASGRGR